jgi:GntR family transcriptional regulator/MocR family aminotransferase
VADPERIVVCTGFNQGLTLVTRALARRGMREIAFEDPGYADQWEIARHAGLRVAPIPLDEKGIDVDALAATSARAVVLTPAHQSPSGVVLGPDRRQALIEWAGERDATILEDDYDAEFRYDREPVGALQGLAPERVAAFGTVSKSLAPGLRLGWVACPPGLAETVADEKRRDDHGSPTLDQLTLARLIESGRYDKHLRRMRAVYGKRRKVLVDALRRHAPNVELTGLAAGFHAVAKLPDGADEQHVVTRAAERSIKLYPMSTYRHSGATEPAQIVLGFGNLSEGEIERGIEAIRDLLSGA